MDYLVITYTAYIIISFILTLWVGRALFTNGEIFLIDILKSDELLVKAVNKLLLIGFYLINFGYVLKNLIIRKSIIDLSHCIEMLSVKIGSIIIILGLMHFMNLFFLFVLRSKSKQEGKTNLDNVIPAT